MWVLAAEHKYAKHARGVLLADPAPSLSLASPPSDATACVVGEHCTCSAAGLAVLCQDQLQLQHQHRHRHQD